jgi:hypothetical protein
MSMNFKFSRGYSECRAVQPIGVCCYSNTNSTEVLLKQQWQARGVWGPMPDDTEDFSAFYGESHRS